MSNKVDAGGIWLPGPRAALDELRSRARRRIANGDKDGLDLRTAKIRLRDDMGRILFEGTLEEAAGELLPAGRPNGTRLN